MILRLLSLALLLTGSAFAAAEGGKKSILMLAGKQSHGPGAHEHNAGIQLPAKCLHQGMGDKVDVKFHLRGEWPPAEDLAKADTIVIYSDGGKGHFALKDDRL